MISNAEFCHIIPEPPDLNKNVVLIELFAITDIKLSQSEEKMTFLTSMAGTLGCSEEGLRLLLGQLLGYPIILIYRWIIANQRPTIQIRS